MDKNDESLNDYQLGNQKDLDFSKIFELIHTIQEGETINTEDFTKPYVNSLFTPLLSFSIQYLNENEEKEGIIGKSTLENLEVIYLVLNKNIYDLFFQRKKGSIFGGNDIINYERKLEEDNYLIFSPKEEKEFNSKMLENLVLLGEKNLDKNDTLKEVFNFKKREIISGFRLSFSIQERIINTLKSNSDNNILELPNVIFYKKNEYKKILNEIDRIITVEKDTLIKNFMVFSKFKFQKGKSPTKINISEDELLILKKNSCNFIEVKASMNALLNENKQINSDYLQGEIISSIHSSKNSEKKGGITIFENISKFIELYKNFNKFFKSINLIIVIDSYFKKKYIKLAEDFVNSIPEQELDFNLIFVHIKSDITYVGEFDKYQKIEEKLKNDGTSKNLEIEKLKNDAISEIEKLENNAKSEIEKLKKNSEEQDKKISELSNKVEEMQKKLDKLLKENKEREIEEIIRKEQYDNYLNRIVKENEEEIKKSKYNFIIGDYYHKSFKTMNQLISSKIQYNFLIDFKTFVRLTYSKENLYMINDIENKHFNDLNKLVDLNVNKLILLVDFVFILNIVKIMSLYFKNKVLIIRCANNGLHILFLLYFYDRKNSENKCSFLLEENILSYERINLNSISNLYNFINYYYEINDSYNKKSLEYFPIYDPIKSINHYFLSMKETNSQDEDICVLVCNSLFDFEDVSFDEYNDYRYIIILFQSYDFRYDENICNIISNFYFKKEPTFIYKIPDNNKIIFETESQYLTFFGKSSKNNIALIDKQKGRVLFKFTIKSISNNKYMIDMNKIIDKKIKIIIDQLVFNNLEGIDILIEESFNIIYSYLKNIYNKSNILIINGDKNNDFDKIKTTIATIEKKEIKEYLLEFLNKKSELTFDLIISANNLFLEDENKVRHKFLNKDKLINIKNHLKENGIFCFYLYLNNKYLEEKIREKLEIVFDKDNISIFNHKLDYIIICKNN